MKPLDATNHKGYNEEIVSLFSTYHAGLVKYGVLLGHGKSIVEDAIQELFLKFCENEDLILLAYNKEAYMKSSLK